MCRELQAYLLAKYRKGEIALANQPQNTTPRNSGARPTASAEQLPPPPPTNDQSKDDVAKRDRGNQPRGDTPPASRKKVFFIMGGLSTCNDSVRSIKKYGRQVMLARKWQVKSPKTADNDAITFTEADTEGVDMPHNDPLVVELRIADCEVSRILVDTGSSVDLIFKETLDKMELTNHYLKSSVKPLMGFDGDTVYSIGTIRLPVYAAKTTRLVKFVVVDKPAIYNEISRLCFAAEHKLRSKSAIPAKACLTILPVTQVDLPTQERPKQELVIQVNIDESDPERCVGIGADLKEEIKVELVRLLRRNATTFAWSVSDMLGIDPSITSHELNIDPTFKPIKQKRRKLGSEKAQAVNDEIERLSKAGSIIEVKYPEWLANPVVVKKKNGKWRICVDFTDLNKACPKDSFPLPHIDRIVEATAGNELLSFMDAFSGYNQITMHPEDREKTSFITDRGTYCYKVMSFGLKNAGATYQRLVNHMFADQLGRTMEVYIDDMLVKSLTAGDHIGHLQACFTVLNQYQMKLNPTKCTFGVTSGEFLGYIVTKRGIEANPKQIYALINLPSPRNTREVQRLTGRIAALNRFITRSTDKCLPFYQLLRGNKRFEWDGKCEEAFQQLKGYLASPPILAKPETGETLYLYIAVSSSAVSGVLVKEDRGEQKPIFYVSKTLDDAEKRYPTLEKLALAVIMSARKLRPYFQSHSIIVLTNQPLRTILHSPSQSGRMAKWAVELTEYDIEYRNKTSAKSQVLADFLVELPPELIQTDLPDENSSNNEAEYEALLAGLRLAQGIGVKKIEAFCDSQLVASQYSGDYDTRNDRMDLYLKAVKNLADRFELFSLTRIPRSDNTSADALAALASTSEPHQRRVIPVESIDSPSIVLPRGVCAVRELEANRLDAIELPPPEVIDEPAEQEPATEDWKIEILLYITDGQVPPDRWAARRLKNRSAKYIQSHGNLYRWSSTGALLNCLHGEETLDVMRETHEGACGNHSNGRALALKIKTTVIFGQ
ncbi:uncharacterized protein LOC112083446 [Eutrema salsugineum]|uniref:uncharacterized protein LOC112083446 n=1 Tax=Eutrema salsugineum TaxID=72664 RepID=UPI000CECF713|nr:uncharacterized protein LOC112083446 [Eutrema salsugineum]